MANIRDIAQRANVSTATVSRVLNDHRNVSEQTRMLVLQTAQDLNYPLPDPARKLIVSRSVLVLVRQGIETASQISGSFERVAWSGAESVLTEKEVITKLQQSPMTVEDAARLANEAGVAGLIILGGVVPPDFLEALQQRGLPFVVAGSHARPLQVNNVMADVADGIRQATAHLLKRGRRRIGFVNGPETTLTSVEKLKGFRLAMGWENLTVEPTHIISAEFSPDSGYQQTKQLLGRVPTLDAIVFADDRIALGGMKALHESGVHIPDDIAITGLGAFDIARFTSPTLTTVGFDLFTLGQIAARRLCDLLIEPNQAPWNILVPTSLMLGESA